MSVNQVAGRYAKSLLDLANSINKSEAILKDMQLLGELADNREVYLLLKSPIIYPSTKLSAMKKLIGDAIDPVSMRFIELTIKKGREKMLPEIADAYKSQYNKAHNLLVVKVTSATALDQTTRQTIIDKVNTLTGNNMTIEIHTHIDASLLGGFIIEYGDMLYDASVNSQVNKLKNSFSKN
jgi:F-type H+-transporting ATPase subunit delta